MKHLRSVGLALIIWLLLPAVIPNSGATDNPPAAPDELTALKIRVQELEAQLAASDQKTAKLQAENDVLREVLSKISIDKPAARPKGSKPFDFNGMRSWIMPAAPDGHTPAPK